MAWAGALATAVLVTEVPWLQTYCQTAHVPAAFWGYAFAWSAAIFAVAEGRKWLIRVAPGSPVRFVAW